MASKEQELHDRINALKRTVLSEIQFIEVQYGVLFWGIEPTTVLRRMDGTQETTDIRVDFMVNNKV